MLSVTNKETHAFATRRDFLSQCGIAGTAATLTAVWPQACNSEALPEAGNWSLNYILASPMYGTLPLPELLAEAHKTGATAVDIWPRIHANHREQMDEMGFGQVEQLLDENDLRLGAITRYDLGPSRIAEEIPVLSRFGGRLLVCGAPHHRGNPSQDEIESFIATMKPYVHQAAEHGITIGIENHANTLLSSLESIRRFADSIDYPNLGVALAPYHLPQNPEVISCLIEEVGPRTVFFQAWQHGKGSKKQLPNDETFLQMPGRGPLDFRPILASLKRIDYRGWTEIFMHPVPRGIPIRPTTHQVTSEINQARAYLDDCVASTAP